MSMPPIVWEPDRKTLAEFSEAGMFATGMVVAPLAILRGNLWLGGLAWGLAVAFRVVGLTKPRLLKPVFVGMSLATWPIGWVVSNLVLALVYYGVVTPIGLALRLGGRDLLKRRMDREATSYWEGYSPDQGQERYLRPF